MTPRELLARQLAGVRDPVVRAQRALQVVRDYGALPPVRFKERYGIDRDTVSQSDLVGLVEFVVRVERTVVEA